MIDVHPGDRVVCYVSIDSDDGWFENPYPKANRSEREAEVEEFFFARPATQEEIDAYRIESVLR